jgi:hypothetical protein
MSWKHLADPKESKPVEVAAYVAPRNLLYAPAFFWWVPYFLNKCSRIIDDVINRYHNLTHKFVIEVPKSFDDCVRLNKENGNILWQDAVSNEMKNVIIVFQILNGGESVPQIYQEIRYRVIFDVKM